MTDKEAYTYLDEWAENEEGQVDDPKLWEAVGAAAHWSALENQVEHVHSAHHLVWLFNEGNCENEELEEALTSALVASVAELHTLWGEHGGP